MADVVLMSSAVFVSCFDVDMFAWLCCVLFCVVGLLQDTAMT